jgi:hypothetical protein
LLAIVPRVESRLTAQPELRPHSPSELLFWSFAPRSRGTFAAAFSTAREVDEADSDAPCRLPETRRHCACVPRANQHRFPHRRVNDGGFHGPERLSSTNAPAKGTRHSFAGFAAAR